MTSILLISVPPSFLASPDFRVVRYMKQGSKVSVFRSQISYVAKMALWLPQQQAQRWFPYRAHQKITIKPLRYG